MCSSDLALLNYSEMPETLKLWHAIIRNGLPQKQDGRIFFFDLSDISGHCAQSIEDVMTGIQSFRPYGRTFLSVNENEFARLITNLCGNNPEAAFADRESVALLKQHIPVDVLIARTLSSFYAVDENGRISEVQNRYAKDPKVLTGTGDNQNAGICAALLCDMPMEQVLQAGVCCGWYYMTKGHCVPNWNTLSEQLNSSQDCPSESH